jgi:uncharacterized protein (UPF0332 family)
MTGLRVERARDELDAARHLAVGGFAAQAISRAYYAAFYAAQAALAALGEVRSRHSALIAAFGKLVVREGGLAVEAGALLRSLFEGRNDADYDEVAVSREEADAAIADAERFVDAVEGWLARRGE